MVSYSQYFLCFVILFDYWLFAAALPPPLIFAQTPRLLPEAATGEPAPAVKTVEC
jgi:hypothetical protein